MSAITWSLSDERSDIFDGWGVVRGRLFELGDRDMSIEKVYEVIKGYQCSELLMVLNPALAVWNHQQKEIDSLKAQLNNMERCYIEKKKEAEENLRCFRIAHDHGTERENKVKELQSRINDAECRGASCQ